MKLKFTTVLYYLGMFMFIIGYLFKIQHWPYGMQIFIGGFAIIIISGIISVIQYNKKRKLKE
ncbi:hypothetical protein [Kordia jejudonensis]|uniref:hypothetical protein n=1 Tax=Kordia jejudonensis TaxID=1348245 RepID=UPI0006294AF9|nr:hypothetical protein [Kordia jejudonensis]